MGNHRLETVKISHLFLLFVLPAVISMVLAGIQSVVDGIFLGRYSTTNAMASVTIAIPYMQMIIGCTMIVCSGTLSYLGRTLGEKKASSIRKAQDIFFSSFLALCVASIFLMIIGTFADEWLATIMGANQVLLKDTSQYVFVIALFSPSIALMLLFGLTGRLLGKPNLILYCTVICVLANIFLDWLMIKHLHMGTFGAALATGLSYVTGLLVAMKPFLDRKNILNVFHGRFCFMYLKHTVLNGSSEGINSIATAVTVWIFNMALIYYAGEDGVSAFAVINYLGSFVILIMFGVADGITTLVSYNYGAGLFQRVRRILNSALLLNFAVGVLIFLVMNFYSEGLVGMFVTNNPKIVEMAVQGAQLYSLAFLFNGINIVYSGYQTALGNALNSAVIAGSRGLIFIVIGALLLPLLFDLNGVWLTISFAEACTLLICLCTEKKQKYSIA